MGEMAQTSRMRALGTEGLLTCVRRAILKPHEFLQPRLIDIVLFVLTIKRALKTCKGF